MALTGLSEIVGHENVLTDREHVAQLSNDLYFWPDAQLATAVVVPESVAILREVVRWAGDSEHRLFVRGGGMSSSAGFVPNRPESLLLDLRKLNAVRQLSLEDGFVQVEAGITWQDLQTKLDEHQMVPVFDAPISGSVSTVGGALSQSITGDMAGLLGLEIIDGTGELLVTGSAMRTDNCNPFFRQFGPDLTGLFCGDCGALGIKTAATLSIMDKAVASAHASFAFECFSDLLGAVSQCSRLGVLTKCIGLDPVKSQNAPRVGFKQSIETLAAMLDGSARQRIAEALRLAREGRNFMAGVKWSLHLSADGASHQAAEADMDLARHACIETGREIPNLLPLALSVKPFSVRGFLGPEGERWVPINAVFPYSAAKSVARRLQAYFENCRARMNSLGVWESYLVRGHVGHVTIEPSLYWSDEVGMQQRAHLDERSSRRFATHAVNLPARQFVGQLHGEILDLLDAAGAAHIQLGRTYQYAGRVAPAAMNLVRALKEELDPKRLLNAGNLGLAES